MAAAADADVENPCANHLRPIVRRFHDDLKAQGKGNVASGIAALRLTRVSEAGPQASRSRPKRRKRTVTAEQMCELVELLAEEWTESSQSEDDFSPSVERQSVHKRSMPPAVFEQPPHSGHRDSRNDGLPTPRPDPVVSAAGETFPKEALDSDENTTIKVRYELEAFDKVKTLDLGLSVPASHGIQKLLPHATDDFCVQVKGVLGKFLATESIGALAEHARLQPGAHLHLLARKHVDVHVKAVDIAGSTCQLTVKCTPKRMLTEVASTCYTALFPGETSELGSAMPIVFLKKSKPLDMKSTVQEFLTSDLNEKICFEAVPQSNVTGSNSSPLLRASSIMRPCSEGFKKIDDGQRRRVVNLNPRAVGTNRFAQRFGSVKESEPLFVQEDSSSDENTDENEDEGETEDRDRMREETQGEDSDEAWQAEVEVVAQEPVETGKSNEKECQPKNCSPEPAPQSASWRLPPPPSEEQIIDIDDLPSMVLRVVSCGFDTLDFQQPYSFSLRSTFVAWLLSQQMEDYAAEYELLADDKVLDLLRETPSNLGWNAKEIKTVHIVKRPSANDALDSS